MGAKARHGLTEGRSGCRSLRPAPLFGAQNKGAVCGTASKKGAATPNRIVGPHPLSLQKVSRTRAPAGAPSGEGDRRRRWKRRGCRAPQPRRAFLLLVFVCANVKAKRVRTPARCHCKRGKGVPRGKSIVPCQMSWPSRPRPREAGPMRCLIVDLRSGNSDQIGSSIVRHGSR